MVLEMMVACVQSHYKTDVHHSVLRHFNKDVVFPSILSKKLVNTRLSELSDPGIWGSMEKSILCFTPLV